MVGAVLVEKLLWQVETRGLRGVSSGTVSVKGRVESLMMWSLDSVVVGHVVGRDSVDDSVVEIAVSKVTNC